MGYQNITSASRRTRQSRADDAHVSFQRDKTMASKDRYDKKIKCPKCDEMGTLHISENDYPFMRKLGRSVDSVEGNFIVEMVDDTKIKILCGNCSEKFSK